MTNEELAAELSNIRQLHGESIAATTPKAVGHARLKCCAAIADILPHILLALDNAENLRLDKLRLDKIEAASDTIEMIETPNGNDGLWWIWPIDGDDGEKPFDSIFADTLRLAIDKL